MVNVEYHDDLKEVQSDAELARLLSRLLAAIITAGRIGAYPMWWAQRAAELTGAIVLLKGHALTGFTLKPATTEPVTSDSDQLSNLFGSGEQRSFA